MYYMYLSFSRNQKDSEHGYSDDYHERGHFETNGIMGEAFTVSVDVSHTNKELRKRYLLEL